MWNQYYIAETLNDALNFLSQNSGDTRILSGATDLLLELKRGLSKTNCILDISRISSFDQIQIDSGGTIHIGPLVSHNQAAKSDVIQKYATCLAEACYQVGSPQIRNRATIAGNLVTGSPANDAITPLIALNAEIKLTSSDGERLVKLTDIYRGVRKTIIRSNELVTEIVIPPAEKTARSVFYKYALRKAQAISVVNAAVNITLTDDTIVNVIIAVGAVAPTIVRLKKVEAYLQAKRIENIDQDEISKLIKDDISPISDIRSEADYRESIVGVIINRCIERITRKEFDCEVPKHPVTLEGMGEDSEKSSLSQSYLLDESSIIETEINGQKYTTQNAFKKTLLDLIREDALLTGSKEGCAEGECGACTIYLDGKAVMACLVPAPRAHKARIVTIEGVSTVEHMHKIQEEFIEEGAVQCGYCTPGFVMSAVKLLEEKPNPTQDEIKMSFTGNLCRCTGYYKIIKAVEKAAARD